MLHQSTSEMALSALKRSIPQYPHEVKNVLEKLRHHASFAKLAEFNSTLFPGSHKKEKDLQPGLYRQCPEFATAFFFKEIYRATPDELEILGKIFAERNIFLRRKHLLPLIRAVAQKHVYFDLDSSMRLIKSAAESCATFGIKVSPVPLLLAIKKSYDFIDQELHRGSNSLLVQKLNNYYADLQPVKQRTFQHSTEVKQSTHKEAGSISKNLSNSTELPLLSECTNCAAQVPENFNGCSTSSPNFDSLSLSDANLASIRMNDSGERPDNTVEDPDDKTFSEWLARGFMCCISRLNAGNNLGCLATKIRFLSQLDNFFKSSDPVCSSFLRVSLAKILFSDLPQNRAAVESRQARILRRHRKDSVKLSKLSPNMEMAVANLHSELARKRKAFNIEARETNTPFEAIVTLTNLMKTLMQYEENLKSASTCPVMSNLVELWFTELQRAACNTSQQGVIEAPPEFWDTAAILTGCRNEPNAVALYVKFFLQHPDLQGAKTILGLEHAGFSIDPLVLKKATVIQRTAKRHIIWT